MFKEKLLSQLNSVEEYERTPIPENKLKGWKSFIGMYAGEHTAGTEFVIGPLFVAHGVAASDLLFGLLLGNILAVLSWAFLTGPIAVNKRITLYYLLEKISGKKVTTVYNSVNALNVLLFSRFNDCSFGNGSWYSFQYCDAFIK